MKFSDIRGKFEDTVLILLITAIFVFSSFVSGYVNGGLSWNLVFSVLWGVTIGWFGVLIMSIMIGCCGWNELRD